MTAAPLSVGQASEIAIAIIERQRRFHELLDTSVKVVLLNYGDRFTPVSCVGGEWSGIKDDLPRSGDLPRCPNGHVLLESDTGRKALGLIDVEPMMPPGGPAGLDRFA